MTLRQISIALIAPLALAGSSSAGTVSFEGGQLEARYGGGDGVGIDEFATISMGRKTVEVESGNAAEFENFVKSPLYRLEDDADTEAGPTFNIDVDATMISISGFQNLTDGSGKIAAAPFFGFIFSDFSNAFSPFASVSVASSAVPMVDLGPDRIAFDDDHIYVNWQNLNYVQGTIVNLSVTFAPDASPETPVVPAPAAAPGIVALLLLVRRNRRSTNVA